MRKEHSLCLLLFASVRERKHLSYQDGRLLSRPLPLPLLPIPSSPIPRHITPHHNYPLWILPCSNVQIATLFLSCTLTRPIPSAAHIPAAPSLRSPSLLRPSYSLVISLHHPSSLSAFWPSCRVSQTKGRTRSRNQDRSLGRRRRTLLLLF